MNPNGAYVVTLERSENPLLDPPNEIYLWSTENEKLVDTLMGHQSSILDLSFSADGSYLVSADNTGTVKVWNLQTKAQLKEFQHTSFSESVVYVSMSEGNEYLFTSGDGLIKVWEFNSGTEVLSFNSQHSLFPLICVAPDLDYFLGFNAFSGDENSRIVKLWDFHLSAIFDKVDQNFTLDPIHADEIHQLGLGNLFKDDPDRFNQFLETATAQQLREFGEYYRKQATQSNERKVFEPLMIKAEHCYF